MASFKLQSLMTVSLTFVKDFSTAFVIPANTSPIFRVGNKRSNVSSKMALPDREELSREKNERRTDVRNLLTQRSIQSFMYLADSLRDPHSCRWIEEFLDTQCQLEFHGTGAGYMERFGGTWDAPLLEMMEQPKHEIQISAKRTGKGYKGWSKDNPYLEDRYFNYTIDIDPVSLVGRILSVREQIAAEWETDMDVIDTANEMILGSYFRIAEEERSKNTEEELARPSFESTAVFLLNNHTTFVSTSSSPLRKGNFDLLYNLCTQESVHRILRSSSSSSRDDVSLSWLRDFYLERVEEYFDGDQSYGQADAFMDELLKSSPRVMKGNDGKVGLADPMGMAEAIIEERKTVVQDWKEMCGNVPQVHADGIRRVLLEKQMQAWNMPSNSGGFQ